MRQMRSQIDAATLLMQGHEVMHGKCFRELEERHSKVVSVVYNCFFNVFFSVLFFVSGFYF